MTTHDPRDDNREGARVPTSTCRAAAVDYQTRLGWSVYALESTVWLTPGGRIEAFNVPREIGQRTMMALRALDLSLPAINIPGPPDRWALLTRPHDGPVADILVLFAGARRGLCLHGPTQRPVLGLGYRPTPTRHPNREPLSWITPPETPLLPAILVAHIIVAALTE